MRDYSAQNITVGRNYDGNSLTPSAGGISVGASATNTVITQPHTAVSALGSLNCKIKITASAVTAATGITAKLQTATNPTGTWLDSKTVTISGNGDFYISLQTSLDADKTYLPLLTHIRVVASSGAGDAATFSLVEFIQAQ